MFSSDSGGPDERLRAYLQREKIEQRSFLGAGYDGTVIATDRKSAIKIYKWQELFERERRVYHRLQERGIEELAGCQVPRLLGFCDELLVLEMTIVRPPYVLDFAGAYLDQKPDYPADVKRQWEREKRRQFGQQWRFVPRIVVAFENLGIYLADLNPGNICLLGYQPPPVAGRTENKHCEGNMESQNQVYPAGLIPLRVCAFESRRGDDIRSLIERQGGQATVAPSMREIPLGDNPQAFEFAERLLKGEFDIVVFMTGVGAKGLLEVLETRYSRESLFAALAKTTLIVRGPKPAAVMREWQVKFDHQVREPNTWRELLELLDTQVSVTGKRVAIQEYGLPSTELYDGLRERQAEVTAVPVYRWDLPVDTAPLQAAVHSTIAGEFDILMWTSSFQLTSVLTVAESLGLKQQWLDAANRCVIASIGPTATEHLIAEGLTPDLEPEHPKMGQLVKESLERGRDLLARKRGG